MTRIRVTRRSVGPTELLTPDSRAVQRGTRVAARPVASGGFAVRTRAAIPPRPSHFAAEYRGPCPAVRRAPANFHLPRIDTRRGALRVTSPGLLGTALSAAGIRLSEAQLSRSNSARKTRAAAFVSAIPHWRAPQAFPERRDGLLSYAGRCSTPHGQRDPADLRRLPGWAPLKQAKGVRCKTCRASRKAVRSLRRRREA